MTCHLFACPRCGSRSFEIQGMASVRVYYDLAGKPGTISAPFNTRWNEGCVATCMSCQFTDRLAAMKPTDLRDQSRPPASLR